MMAVVVTAFRRHWAWSVVTVGCGVVAATVRLAEGADRWQRSDALVVVQVGRQFVVAFACLADCGQKALPVAILEHLCVTEFPKSTDFFDTLPRVARQEAKVDV